MAEPTQPTASKPPDVAVEDDSDPDFDDLDDVLDQFSTATASQQPATVTSAAKSQHDPTPSSSGPGRPGGDGLEPGTSSATALPSDIPIPSGPKPNESEDEFLARLTAEMSTVMSKFSMDPAVSTASPEDIAKMGQELEEFTQRMEAEGIQPEDMLKAILGEDAGSKVVDVAEKERDRRESESQPKSRSPEKSRPKDQTSTTAESSSSQPKSPGKSKSKAKAKPADSFEDTIRKTMARMESSSAAASSATQKSTAAKSEEDMLAEMLRALDAEGGGGGGAGGEDGDLSKMFLGMMEQLTNKEMLYEPMKELSTKYPSWLEENTPAKNPKLTPSEHDRFSRQRVIVDEIVAKFEMKGYSDDDPKCREFIWEKMQLMQGEGAPPEDLVANPFPGMGMPGLGLGDGAEALEEGCPTQ
ncbi:hypothetical protein LTR84_003027 [Exophiala bonariae]|uniref:Peroxin-19 n=1 Tax=Exophiala bonariae TaxID=1690606 RepID=A0AAV9NC93_9EURO|nr:hypothetical protein LTR84_003027 [Exophiala bonariae]